MMTFSPLKRMNNFDHMYLEKSDLQLLYTFYNHTHYYRIIQCLLLRNMLLIKTLKREA